MSKTNKDKPKTKKISYKPPIQALVKRQAGLIAKDVKKVERAVVERRVVKMVVRGMSYDRVAARMGIDTQEAFNIVKSNTERWIKEQSLDAVSARELEIKRLDAVLELAMYEAFPHPLRDDFGKIIRVRNCHCPVDDDNKAPACIIDDHNIDAMSRPDRAWADMALDVSRRRSALLGLDAANKLEEKKVDLLTRIYEGVDSDVIDQL